MHRRGRSVPRCPSPQALLTALLTKAAFGVVLLTHPVPEPASGEQQPREQQPQEFVLLRPEDRPRIYLVSVSSWLLADPVLGSDAQLLLSVTPVPDPAGQRQSPQTLLRMAAGSQSFTVAFTNVNFTGGKSTVSEQGHSSLQ